MQPGPLHYHVEAINTPDPAHPGIADFFERLAAHRVEGGLALITASGMHAEDLPALTRRAIDATGVAHAVAIEAAGVVAGAKSFESDGTIGITILAGANATARPINLERLPHLPPDPTDEDLAGLAEAAQTRASTAASLLLTDPTSTPLVRTLPALAGSRPLGAGPLIGGLASGRSLGTGRSIALDAQPVPQGVLIHIEGDLTIDASVSQGARAVGEPFVITAARENVILKLGGRPALTRVKEVLDDLSHHDRHLFTSGLLLGRVINEYQPRFGRDDFLIRPVLGLDQQSGAVAVGDSVKTGQTVQFHVRDAQAASDDLGMLLDAAQLREPTPVGALLITCVARGGEFFDQPNHDPAMVARAFATKPLDPGSEAAKAGIRIEPAPTGLPISGFFAGGEIGPVGGSGDGLSYLHTHSACIALIRPGRRAQ